MSDVTVQWNLYAGVPYGFDGIPGVAYGSTMSDDEVKFISRF
jgi:hypothetical protein